jgi:hypothetical protein
VNAPLARPFEAQNPQSEIQAVRALARAQFAVVNINPVVLDF